MQMLVLITLCCVKFFQLVDIGQTELEENTAGHRNRKASTTDIPKLLATSFCSLSAGHKMPHRLCIQLTQNSAVEWNKQLLLKGVCQATHRLQSKQDYEFFRLMWGTTHPGSFTRDKDRWRTNLISHLCLVLKLWICPLHYHIQRQIIPRLIL